VDGFGFFWGGKLHFHPLCSYQHEVSMKEPAILPAVINMADSSGNRAGNGSKKHEIFVKEELKIAVRCTLDKFRYDEEQKGKVLNDFVLF
jgi:hypothetical protein